VISAKVKTFGASEQNNNEDEKPILPV